MALNTWAANNIGPDADISRMPGSGGGGGEGDFANLTKLEYVDTDGTLTFELYTYAEFYNQWADGGFSPYFVYNGETYIFTSVLEDGENYYSAVAHNTETHTDNDIEGNGDSTVTVSFGDGPK